jgi:histidinol-phosphate aminotransferase
MNSDFSSGVSRRNFMRILGAASAAATSFPAFAVAQQQDRRAQGGGGDDMGDRMVRPADAVIISSNENPLGMSTSALEAISKLGNGGGRYHQEIKAETVKVFNQCFNLKPGYVSFFPGSGGPLDLAFYSNVGPDRDLVVGEPSYEQGASAGAKMKANVHRVPLTETGAHDVKAMLAAGGPNVGAFYITNPNNPTGTMTPKADIAWLVANKPAGSVVVVDEAYHHFSNDDSSIDLVAADKDVIVLRTFSKIYGMAGMRAGFFIAKPELQAKLSKIGTGVTANGSGIVSIATAVACTASLQDAGLIPARRKINTDIRENVLGWMDKNGYAYMKGSQANFFQADVKRPGPEFAKLMQQDHVYVGRTWKAMPNYIRVTIGTQAEMEKFKVSFKKAYETAPGTTAHLEMPYVAAPSELYRHHDGSDAPYLS